MVQVIRFLIFTLIPTTSFAASSLAPDKESRCTWESPVADTQAAVTHANAFLNLSASQRAASIQTHLPFGVPLNPPEAQNEHLLVQRHYVLNYDDDLRISLWAGYRLQNTDIVTLTRRDSFRSDPRLSDDAKSTCVDYKEKIFDQGHIVPRAAMNRSEDAMANTFIMSNMTPQHCAFNRGVWRILEAVVREWATTKGTIYVFTGVFLNRDDDELRDADSDAWRMLSEVSNERRVAIPSHQYKIVLYERPNGFIDTISLVLPNTDDKISNANSHQYLTDGIRSIDYIEARTGIRFLPDLANSNPNKERAVTAFLASVLWTVDHGSWPTTLAGPCKNNYPDN